MTDAQLEAKFEQLSEPVLGADKTRSLIAAAWKIGDSPNVRGLTDLSRP
jgi:hypothetical protein